MRTVLTRVNPLVLLAVGGFSFAGSFFVRDLRTALIALVAWGVAALLVLPTWKFPLVCLGFSLFGSLTVVYSAWRLGSGGLEPAVVQGLRLVVLAWPGSVAIGFLDTSRLGDHLAQSLKLPARPVAAFSASLQRFTSFGHAWTQLERSRRVRGLGTSRNPLANLRWIRGMAFALLVHAMRGATRSSIAMDARGFADAAGRTWAEPAQWTRLDRVALGVAATLGAVPVVVHVLG